MLPVKQRESVTADIAQIWQGVRNFEQICSPSINDPFSIKRAVVIQLSDEYL